jgi:SMC interacting uncharacterized protein involved in chromosome segregation
MLRWFKTRRALLADIKRQRDLLAAKDNQIREKDTEISALVGEMDNGWARADEQIRNLETTAQIGADQIRRLTAERDDLRQQVTRVRIALQVLRDDIRREERTAPGMARSADRPLPWQAHDAIAQETTAKRNEDI